MSHQILAAVNADGKRMPMCHYPDQMHDFDALPTATIHRDGVTTTASLIACRYCGAELCVADSDAAAATPSQSNRITDDGSAVRYWDDRSQRGEAP